MAAQSLVPAAATVDHLLLGAADLDAAITWFEAKSGVRAVPGGSHPGAGTRNALASLGGRCYLEIIAPDPAQNTYNSRFDVRGLATPRMITWAATTKNVDDLLARARAAGLMATGPNTGTRARPDGRVLKWRTATVQSQLTIGVFDPLPFFIEWDRASVHPSADSPRGCELQSLEVKHPHAEAVAATLQRLGIELAVTPGAAFELRAVLSSPRGKVEMF
jgi:Glyoxalase-like domain